MRVRTWLDDHPARPWPTTRRGASLFVLSTIVGWVGLWNYALTPPSPQQDRALGWVLRYVPLHVEGWILVGVAATGMFCSYCRRGRDLYGFLLVASACWAFGIAYTLGIAFYGASVKSMGSIGFWIGWGVMAAVVSGFPDLRIEDRR